MRRKKLFSTGGVEKAVEKTHRNFFETLFHSFHSPFFGEPVEMWKTFSKLQKQNSLGEMPPVENFPL